MRTQAEERDPRVPSSSSEPGTHEMGQWVMEVGYVQVWDGVSRVDLGARVVVGFDDLVVVVSVIVEVIVTVSRETWRTTLTPIPESVVSNAS